MKESTNKYDNNSYFQRSIQISITQTLNADFKWLPKWVKRILYYLLKNNFNIKDCKIMIKTSLFIIAQYFALGCKNHEKQMLRYRNIHRGL